MGDETEALYREHGAAVAAFCGSLLRDRAEAEDAAQQVFLSAHRALLNGSAPREPLAWLLTVARHECYARFRQRATVAVPTGDVPDGAAADASVHVLRAGELATMWDEVGRMPAAQREAFLLREVRGLSYGQLADQLSLSPPSVRSLLLRARTRLRHRLRDVAAGFGGAPWIQALVRLAAGDGASPVAATKAAAVGLGALALVGGADVAPAPHHVSKPPARSAAHRRAEARLRHVAEPAAAAPAEDRGSDGRSSTSGHARDRGGSGSRRGSDDRVSSSASSSGESSSDGGDDHGSTTTVVAQPTTDGRDGHDGDRSPSAGSGSDGGSGSSGSDRSGSPQGSGSGDGGSDGGSGGSGTGSDGGPDGGSGSGPGG